MGSLKDWANAQSPFIKIGDGDSFQGKYQGFKESSYKGTPLIEYSFLDSNGEKKVLSSGSGKLATRMDSVSQGSEVKITRYGQGTDTNYEVEMIQDSSKSETAWDEEDNQ